MHLGHLRTRRLRERVILLLLPVLAFRLLFPAGFMPRFGDDHQLTMQMCHGDAQSAAVIRMLGQERPAPSDSGQRHESPCVFAAVGAFVTPEPPGATLGAVTHPLPTPHPAAESPQLRLPHRPQSPRAPPLHV